MNTFDVSTIAKFLTQWEIDHNGSPLSKEQLCPVNERLKQFVEAQARRYALTLDLIPKSSPGGTLLEIGSAPYLMSLLLRHLLSYTVAHTNLSHDPRLPAPVVFRNKTTGERSSFVWDELNVEVDRFPYPDQSFEVVVCCEVIEHLTMSPVHMLSEIHRVLKDKGLLILTTPNSLRLSNVRSLISGMTVYERYRRDSAYAAYGRHNREYTPGELQNLCNAVGFSVEHCETSDIYPRPSGLTAHLLDAWIMFPLALRSLLSQRIDTQLSMKKDLVFIRAVKSGPFQEAFPEDVFYPLES